MVCPRCIETVRGIFSHLKIEVSHVELGEVTTLKAVSNDKKQVLSELLINNGFEILEDKTSRLITQLKSIIIDQIHYDKDKLSMNFSTLLSEKLHQDYNSMSKLFSTVEGITIEKYIIKQKIERVKELIVYDERSLSEIAFQLNYSSVAHLSAQFKKETGMTPSAFKKLGIKGRRSLDSI